MEAFFENGTLSDEELSKGIRQGIATRTMFPVMCASGKNNQGVGRFMEFITENLPSPVEVIPEKDTQGNELRFDEKKDTVAFVFKTAVEPHLGELSFFRVYEGVVQESADLINSDTESKERLSQLFVVAGRTGRR